MTRLRLSLMLAVALTGCGANSTFTSEVRDICGLGAERVLLIRVGVTPSCSPLDDDALRLRLSFDGPVFTVGTNAVAWRPSVAGNVNYSNGTVTIDSVDRENRTGHYSLVRDDGSVESGEFVAGYCKTVPANACI